jgi:hypothetical protein
MMILGQDFPAVIGKVICRGRLDGQNLPRLDGQQVSEAEKVLADLGEVVPSFRDRTGIALLTQHFQTSLCRAHARIRWFAFPPIPRTMTPD